MRSAIAAIPRVDAGVDVTFDLMLQCPYCRVQCLQLRAAVETQRFSVGDAMLCQHCGNIGTLQEGWLIHEHTDKDIERWMCESPIGWESFEMMAAEYRRRAAVRKREV